MNEQDITNFRRTYNALINNSHHQYSRPVIVDNFSGAIAEDIKLTVETGIDITLMRDYFHELVRDAARGREHRRISQMNPAVQAAYQEYQVLLELTRKNYE